jgi:hypothetical protein
MTDGRGWAEFPLGASWQREETLVAELSDDIRRVVERMAAINGSRLRGNHAKLLAATTTAEFHIADGVPHDLRYGPFARMGARYPTTVRFSNGSSHVNPDDAVADLRGIAMRVFAEDGTYDFLATNAEPSHARDAVQTMALTVAAIERWRLLGAIRLARMIGLREAVRMLRALSAQVTRPVESLATETFWSRAAIAIGGDPERPDQSVAAKYRLTPFAQPSPRPRREHDLGGELAARLREGPVRYRFEIQRFADDVRTPIEDASIVWPTPFEVLGELVLPRQVLNDAERQAIDALDFSPWFVNRQVMKPIGNINRARGPVYAASVQCRRKKGEGGR